MLPEQFIFFALLLNLSGSFWYIKSIISGDTKPNLVSWVLWLLGPFLGVFFQLKAGAGLSVLPIFMGGFGPLIIVIASILNKKAHWKINTFDLICGFFSLVALVCYVITHNLGISIVFAILSDALAFVPTFIKGWKFPETEPSAPYLCFIFANIIGLLVIKNWSFTIYSFGLYFIIANIVMLLILHRKKIFNLA